MMGRVRFGKVGVRTGGRIIKNAGSCDYCLRLVGDLSGARTQDPLLKREMLYLLS